MASAQITKGKTMKILNAKVHGYLDYLVVLIFLAAPSLLHLSMLPAAISYTLAAVHLLVTIATDFQLGLLKVLHLKWHGIIELIVGPVLIALPFVLGMGSEPAAQYFYVVNGVVILLVWFLTDYGSSKKS
jgi:hypothetical protein